MLQIKICWNKMITLRSINQGRPVNTISSSVSFLRLDKNYGPRKYDKSTKTQPSTHALPLSRQ